VGAGFFFFPWSPHSHTDNSIHRTNTPIPLRFPPNVHSRKPPSPTMHTHLPDERWAHHGSRKCAGRSAPPGAVWQCQLQAWQTQQAAGQSFVNASLVEGSAVKSC
jgi:hypothetical protein